MKKISKNFLIVLVLILMSILFFVLARYDIPSDVKNRFQNFFRPNTKKIDYCDTTKSLVSYENLNFQLEKITCKAAFSPRDGAGALVFNDSMWMLGGWNPKDKKNFPNNCNNEVWKSGDGLNWLLVKPNTYGESSFNSSTDWEGRHGAGFLVYKEKMWIIGGDNNQGHYQNDIWNSIDGINWNKISDSAPWSPRVFYTVAVFKNKIWIFGGQTFNIIGDSKQQYFADAWSTENGKDWEHHLASNNHWLPRGLIIGHAVFQDKIWMLGGSTYSIEKHIVKNYYNDIWSSKNGYDWSCELLQAPWVQRSYQNVATWDNKLWVIAGAEGQFHEAWNRNDIWYSDNGVTWNELPNPSWESRHAAAVFDYKDALWLVGGNNMYSDVWKLSKITRN